MGTLIFSRTLPLLPLLAATALAQTVPNIKDVLSCPNSPDGSQPYRVNTTANGDMRRIVINAPNALCNDGTPPTSTSAPPAPAPPNPTAPPPTAGSSTSTAAAPAIPLRNAPPAGAASASGKAP